ncbi:MAG TPA: hypothetical protein VLU54_16945 [Casimicrobiaceae bacterium]|nr:hypothetical protein [Casimicrobiaceae bacterium]
MATPPASGSPATPRMREGLAGLGASLRTLHRVLVERSRRDFERRRHAILGAGELLKLLTSDAHFAWLRELSELIVDLDIFLDVDPAPGDDDAAAVRAEVERLLAPPPGMAIGAAADAAPGGAERGPPAGPVPGAGAAPSPAAGDGFGARYWPYVHDDPQVAIAHGEVKQALRRLPDPRDIDEAAVLHARHLFREARNHRV